MSRYNDRGEREYAPPQRPHGAVAGPSVRSSAHSPGADAQDTSARAGPSAARPSHAAASAAAAPAHPWAQRSHRPGADRTRSLPSHAPYSHAPPAHYAAQQHRDAPQRPRPPAAHSSIMPPPGPPRRFADGPFAGSPMPEAYTRAMSRLLSAPPGSDDRSGSSEPRVVAAAPPTRWAAGPSRPSSVRPVSGAAPASGSSRTAGPHISKSDLDFLLSSAASRGPSAAPSVLRGASVLVSPAGATGRRPAAMQAPSSPGRSASIRQPYEHSRAGEASSAPLCVASEQHIQPPGPPGAEAPALGSEAHSQPPDREQSGSQARIVQLDEPALAVADRQDIADEPGGAEQAMLHDGPALHVANQPIDPGEDDAPQDVHMTQADAAPIAGASAILSDLLPAEQAAQSEPAALQLPDASPPQALVAPSETAELVARGVLPLRERSAPLSSVADVTSASEPQNAPEGQALAAALPLADVPSAPQPPASPPAALVEPTLRSEPTSTPAITAPAAPPSEAEPSVAPLQHADSSARVATRPEAPPKPAVELRSWFLTAAPGKPSSSLGISELGLRHWLYVEGTVRKPDGGEEQWHSSLVVRRQDPTTVLTASGSRYLLLGPMAKRISMHNGWSAELCEHFADGFPDDWVHLAAHDIAQQEARARQAKLAASRRSVASAGLPADAEAGEEAAAGPSEPKKRSRASKGSSATKKTLAEEMADSKVGTADVAAAAALDRTSKAGRSSAAASRKKPQAHAIATAVRQEAGPSSKLPSAPSDAKPSSTRPATARTRSEPEGRVEGLPSPSQRPIKAGARKRPRDSVLPPSSPESPEKPQLGDAGRDRPPSVKKARPDEDRSRDSDSRHAMSRAKPQAQSKAQIEEPEQSSDEEQHDQSSPRESEDDSDKHEAYVPTPRKPKRVPAARRRSDNAGSSTSGSASKIQRHASDPTGSKKPRTLTGKSKARQSEASTSAPRPHVAHFAPPPLPQQHDLDADMPPIDDFGDDSDDLGGLGADDSIIVPGNVSGPVGWIADTDVPERSLAPAEAQEDEVAQARGKSASHGDASLPATAPVAAPSEQLQSEEQVEPAASHSAGRTGVSSSQAAAAEASSQVDAHEPVAALEPQALLPPHDEQVPATAHDSPADIATSNKAVSDDEVDGAIGPPRSPEVQVPSKPAVEKVPAASIASARETTASATEPARATSPAAGSDAPTRSPAAASRPRPRKKVTVSRRASAGTTPKGISREVANLGRTAFGVIGVVRRAMQDEPASSDPKRANEDEEEEDASEPEASKAAAQRSGRPVRARASNGVGRWWEVSGSPMPARATARSSLAPVKAQASVSSTLASPSTAAARKTSEIKARVVSAPQSRPKARSSVPRPSASDASDSDLSSPDDGRAGASARSTNGRSVQSRPSSSTSTTSSAKRRRSQSGDRKAPTTATPRKADGGKSPARPKAPAAASMTRSAGGITFAIADPSEMAADAYDFSD